MQERFGSVMEWSQRKVLSGIAGGQCAFYLTLGRLVVFNRAAGGIDISPSYQASTKTSSSVRC
jgi:hypothetical protein